jgi:D-alanyl-D-alanine carboxypeptidase
MRKTHILPLFLLTLLALAITACGVPSAPAAPTVSATAVAPVPETPVASAILTDETVGKLDALMTQAIDTEGSDPAAMTPGLIILVDAPDGRYLNAMGVASMEEKTPLQPDARMEIGSNSKSFTIVLLLQLQEEGKLSLDDPLSKWLPDWAEKIPYGDAMTLRQLAQHTAGLWDYGGEGPGEGIIGGGATDPERLPKHSTPGELVQYAIDNGDPYFEPGAEGQWHYSNTGYILLGMILEKVTGQSLAELYQERIFDPLNMERAVLIEDVPAADDLDSDGYFFSGVDEYMNTTAWNASQGWAAGALALTAEDLLTYAKALSAGELFRNPDTLQEMLAFDPFAMDGMIPYGLGIQDFSIYGGAPNTWGHTGQTMGFATLWPVPPASAVTIIGLTNSASFAPYSFLAVLEMLGLTP